MNHNNFSRTISNSTRIPNNLRPQSIHITNAKHLSKQTIFFKNYIPMTPDTPNRKGQSRPRGPLQKCSRPLVLCQNRNSQHAQSFGTCPVDLYPSYHYSKANTRFRKRAEHLHVCIMRRLDRTWRTAQISGRTMWTRNVTEKGFRVSRLGTCPWNRGFLNIVGRVDVVVRFGV